jgi:hypothetical protein
MVRRGGVLVPVGILVLVATLGVSAATAPDRTVQRSPSVTPEATPTNATPGTPMAADTSVLVGSQGGGPEWKKHGRIYRIDGQRVVWNHSQADSNFDVTRLADGRVVTGFLERGADSGCNPYDAPCVKTGYRVVDPDTAGGPEIVEEYSFPVRTGTNSEVHDVEPLGDGRFLLADMEYERLLIVEDGTVTWEWRAGSFYEAPPDPTERDWLHINDVDVLDDGRYLVSVRNANQLLVVERGAGVVEVINEDTDGDDASCLKTNELVDANGDGDVRCGDPDVFDHQHNPQWLGDGRVLVADSENDRVVELHEQDGNWSSVWTLSEAGGFSLYWPRDADRLPSGNTLVTDSLNKRVFLVRPNGTVVWSYGTTRIPYEADAIGVGEPTRGAFPVNGDDGTETAAVADPNTDSDIPVLSTLLVGLRAVFPRTPVWFKEGQLALSLLALAMVTGGIVDRTRRQ